MGWGKRGGSGTLGLQLGKEIGCCTASSPFLPPAASNAQGNGGSGALPPFSMPLSSKSTLVLLMQVSNLQTQEKFLMGEITLV